MNDRQLARKLFLHKPDDVSQSYVNWAERLQSEPGITYGCVLDKHMIPLHPGDLMAVVARPGHGKSSYMAYMAKKTALDIVKRGADDEVVVYITWEQPVEEIEAFFQSGGDYTSTDMAWGRVPMDVIRRNTTKRAGLPVWFIGYSNRHAGVKKPRMYVDFVYEAIESMHQEFGKRPKLLLLDYLQIVPVTSGGKRFEQVAEATNLTKELLMNLGVAGIAGVQARRDVDTYAQKIPTMSDAQHSSEIEQRADKQVAIWRPIKDFDPKTHPEVDVAGTTYKNSEELLVVRLLKQRFDAGYGTHAIRFKPQTLEVHDYERRPMTRY
jgi:replicative DNA helicase